MGKMANIIGFIIFSIASIILCLTLMDASVSANTLVGGKIYNSDFSKVVEGAYVTVQCGIQELDTMSLNDGAYAVIFDSDSCHLDSKFSVSASKGSLSNEGSSYIYESEEDQGELVGVVNLNLKGGETGGGKTSTTKRGTWFMCGNTVCDSGESFQTCPADCPENLGEGEELTGINTDSISANAADQETGEAQENATSDEKINNSGITGAVIGEGSEKEVNLTALLAGLVLLLIIAIAIIASVADMQEKKKEKLGAELAQVNVH
jgi:hypothetical protein